MALEVLGRGSGLAAGQPGGALEEGGGWCGARGFIPGGRGWVGCVGRELALTPHSPALLPGKRTKKGMATAKQRLGKILKIHRNGKLLL